MNPEQILVSAYRLISLYNSTQKKPHTYSGGLVLFPAQAHMLEMIGVSEGITQSEIAEEYLLTKGAVSQVVSFLARNGLIERKPSPKGGRSEGLFLSPRGEELLGEHRMLHGEMLAEVTRLAEGLPPDSLEILSQIARVMERHIRRLNDTEKG